ncbi:hypothetical protein KEJ51_02605 [Candidatus Bathyarchaeota archaeon]|nr:hypothetical protein [Candidatus Bathyarchaeota archaeon]MBS7628569.1 hypothetical protein [Candidatus Bathyarchaeota archaeon]
MYEFETVVLLATIFIVIYFTGSLRNRSLLVKYSRIFKRRIQPVSEFTGFRPFGNSGFRAQSRMKCESQLSRLEIAVSLVDRENAMHYPLSLITKESDMVTMWAFISSKPMFNLEIRSKRTVTHQRRPPGIVLETIRTDREELEKYFIIASSNEIMAKKILRDDEVSSSLLRVKDYLNYFLVDMEESRILLSGRLSEKSLESLLDFVIASGGKLPVKSESSHSADI